MSDKMKQGKRKSSGGLWRKVRRKKRQNEDIAMDDVEGTLTNVLEYSINEINESWLEIQI